MILHPSFPCPPLVFDSAKHFGFNVFLPALLGFPCLVEGCSSLDDESDEDKSEKDVQLLSDIILLLVVSFFF